MFSLTLDVRNALTPGAVPTDKATASGLSEDQLLDAIKQADAKIQGYLPAGYTVPMEDIEPNPTITVNVAVLPFRYWSRDIAAYLATLTFKQNKDVSENDPIRLRYEATMADLEAVAAGTYVIPPDATTEGTEQDISVINQYEGAMFGLEDFDLAVGGGKDVTIYTQRTRDRWPW